MDFQLPLGPDETVPLRITERQQKLILDHVQAPKELEGKLRFGVHEDNLVVFEFTLDELEELAEYIAAKGAQTKHRKRARELDALYERICQVLDSYAPMDSDEGEAMPPPGEPARPSLRDFLPPEVADKVDALLEQGKIRSQRQFEETVRGLIEEHDAKPLPELDGLSVNQVVELANGNWSDPESPLSLNPDVSLSELENASILQNARIFLRAMVDAGGIKATAKGNLNRKFVSAMMDAMHWRPGYIEDRRRYAKKFDEHDLEMLSRIRWLLEEGRVIRKFKGHFQVVKKRKAVLDENGAGALLVILFMVHFREMDLACLDGLPECPELEEGIPYTLAMLDRHAATWQPLEELAPKLFFPVVQLIMQSSPIFFEDPLVWCARRRVIGPLREFGLLECKYDEEDEFSVFGIKEVRKTALFNRFLRFNIR